jgi:hypothetical protein
VGKEKPTIANSSIQNGEDWRNYPSGYRKWIADIMAPARFHAEKWSGNDPDYVGSGDGVVWHGQYEPWYGLWKLAEHIGGDERLEAGAANACAAWRDKYAVPNSYNVRDIYKYSSGFAFDWKEHADIASRNTVIEFSKRGYAQDGLSINGGGGLMPLFDKELSREVSYAADAMIYAEARCGAPHRDKLEALIQCLVGDVNENVAWIHSLQMNRGGMIEQWLGSYTTDSHGVHINGIHNFAEGYAVPGHVSQGYAPSIDGATAAWALMHYYDEAASIDGGVSPDPRIIPKLVRLADATWNVYWVDRDQSMKYRFYEDSAAPPQPVTRGAPDLNNMIFPWYAWLYLRTGEDRFRARAEKLFNGTIGKAAGFALDENAAKQFGELTRWTFDGLNWYREGVKLHVRGR